MQTLRRLSREIMWVIESVPAASKSLECSSFSSSFSFFNASSLPITLACKQAQHRESGVEVFQSTENREKQIQPTRQVHHMQETLARQVAPGASPPSWTISSTCGPSCRQALRTLSTLNAQICYFRKHTEIAIFLYSASCWWPLYCALISL